MSIKAEDNISLVSTANAIQTATALITGAQGGYVHIIRDANGKPTEIVICDNQDLSQAVNVWRWNQNGLGFSSTGYNGTYTTAWTIDGHFLADFITVGMLADALGQNYWNLDSGTFVTRKGTVGDFELSNGSLKYTNGYTTIILDRTGLAANYWNGYEMDDDGYRYGVELQKSFVRWHYEDDTGTKRFSISMSSNPEVYAMFDGQGTSNAEITIKHPNAGASYPVVFGKSVEVQGNFLVFGGTKSRGVETDNYSDRLLYCYESPTPLFGDVGEAKLDDDGICYVDIDDIFSETIADKVEYQVFLQKEGQGDCWIAEKQQRYFVIQGTPNLRVAWELKARQKGYHNIRLEQMEYGLNEYEYVNDDVEDYITEQEDLLYG